MCGITGIIAFTEKGKEHVHKINASVCTLAKRGPDGEGIYTHDNVALGHRRLAIIDTSNAASQPFSDHTGRYTIIFNGEFFNFKEHRETLLKKAVPLRSTSDTEVLLYLFIEQGPSFLEKINGFFSLAIYDAQTAELFIARDRYGIKPLLVYKDENILAFASEMKALLAYDIPKVLDKASLFTYLQLNYIPSPNSIFKGVSKLEPGHYLIVKNGLSQKKCYYKIPYKETLANVPDYDSAQKQLAKLLEESVQKRLVSDVPLGCFLSGGIDSSIITALATKHTPHLKTFSIGYKDEPLFDETEYAQLVAKMHKTDHTVFSLSNDDLFENLYQVLDYIDEPFADSSALAVYILSMHTRKHVTVALSGDGADELFAGYNKHSAELKMRNNKSLASLMSLTKPLWDILPKSRNSSFGNKFRQLEKFSSGAQLSIQERYWRWAGYSDEKTIGQLLKTNPDIDIYNKRKHELLKDINADINSVLLTDMNVVLQNDMLTKVDSMSMANSLEVRVPFLDYTVVDYAFSLPSNYKINNNGRKLILKDAFRSQLPGELYNRRKQGFEVPLLKWFRTELKSMITDELLSEEFVREQGLFNYESIKQLLDQLFSSNPNDAAARVWGLIVFQYWWKKYM
jgi:asparagine synthase (glutamine-hydrolysing)